MRLRVAALCLASLLAGAAPMSAALAAYDVLESGILRYKRNAGAQTCPVSFKLVCVNRTRKVSSPEQSQSCGNFSTAVCSTTGSTFATDIFCHCEH